MKRILILSLFLPVMILFSCTEEKESSSPWKLWYEKPASKWTEALPLGNGRIGAMVFGGSAKEQIQFNEETLWSGEPRDYANKGSYQYLEEIRTLLNKGKQAEAEKLAMEKFMSDPLRQEFYQPFGDLWVTFPGHDSISDYKRELDLSTAMVKVSYKSGGILFDRSYFVSQPDQMLVAGFSASKKKSLNFSVALTADHKQFQAETLDGNEISLWVKVEKGAMEGYALLKVNLEGGQLSVDNNEIKVEGASRAWLTLAAATNFENPKSLSADPKQKCNDYLSALPANSNYDLLEKRHLDEYQPYFNRFDLQLGTVSRDSLPTDRRIIDYQTTPDPQLAALYVQYGRYLMIASSRPGTYPANLQGIWNKDLEPAWGSKYTVNINTEMNYWPVEVLNLPEFHMPLFKMLEEVVPSGESVAREHYNLPGWVLHHNTDLWRGAAPINASNHGIWVTGGAWLCHHIWEHYQFTHDIDFLREKFPMMAGAARFFTGFLVKDEKTGWLISTPSNSPENGGLVAGPTMDHAIIRSLFKIVAEASDLLQTDQELAAQLRKMIPQIAPFQIGQHGQLQEWLEDKDDPKNKHRHVSHLWAIHPGKEINWQESPELMEAAKQSLIYRGDEGTGWSLAWKINFWARLKDGDHAYEMVKKLFRPVQFEGVVYTGGGGSYPNLFDAHPPFQIDGNFGGAAGIIEMLLQSHMGEIELLPALPAELPSGWIKGVKARGGFELDFAWENGVVTKVSVLSLAGQPLKIRAGEKVYESATTIGQRLNF